MAYERPGVYVQEGLFATNVNTATGPTIAAFIGFAERGPVVPTLVTSWNQYKSQFGDLDNAYDLGYAVYHYFANGGQAAYVTRVADSTAVKASGGVLGTPTGGSAAPLFSMNAKSPGTWGNGLVVDLALQEDTVIDASTAPKIDVDTLFTLTVKLDGSEVENWFGLSFNPSSTRYVSTVLDLYSSYVESASVAVIAEGTELSVSGITVGDLTANISFSSGSEGSGSIDSTDWANALTSHETITSGLLFNLVGQTSSTIINNAITVMQTRGNSFLIVDTPLNATTKAALEIPAVGYTQSGYAAVYGPALKMFDPKKTGAAAIRNTYPGGAVAGAFVRSEVTRGVAKAPAGYALDLRNVYGLVANLTEAEQASLYKNQQINMFINVPGVGVVINGARTQARNTIEKYITVRRSLNYLKDVLKQKTSFAMFEANDERLWAEISVRLSALLNTFWSTGGLKGQTAGEAFYIVCDATNNTPTDVENGTVNVQVGVSLQTPAEFIVINISQWTGGSTVTTNV